MAEQELTRRKKKRGLIRTMVTKCISKIQKAFDETVLDLVAIEELNQQLIDKEERLRQANSEVEDLISLNEMEVELESAEVYNDQIVSTKLRCSRALSKGQNVGTPSSSGQQTQMVSSVTTSSAASAPAVKLPKLEMENFSGDICQWQTFWSKYDAIIHGCGSLTKVEKFSYLRGLLSGHAAAAIAGLSITEANYDAAITTLKDRFGRTDMVINAHMDKLLNLKPVYKSSDVGQLRKLVDECQIQIKSLETLGKASGAYGALLCPIILKRIPEEIALAYSRRKESSKVDVDDLITFLKSEVDSRERAAVLTRGDQAQQWKQPERRQNFEPRHQRSSAAGLTVSIVNTCVYCKDDKHQSEECSKVDLQGKRELLRKENRCYYCLKPYHAAKNCRSGNSCRICKRKHHESLCNQPVASNPTTEVAASSVNLQTSCKVHLKTAIVRAVGPEKSNRIRILIDGGSQRTFVKRSLAKELGLLVIGAEFLCIKTFGANNSDLIRYDIVELKLKSRNTNDEILVNAIVVNNICSTSLPVTPEPNAGNLISNMERGFADDIGTRIPIGLLIGSDYYWQIVTGNHKRLSDSLVAVETIFGWCIHGQSSTLMNNLVSVNLNCCDELNRMVKQNWEIEALGIGKEASQLSAAEQDAIEQFNNGIKYIGSRYEVPLIWNKQKQLTSDNEEVAKRRFNSLLRRFTNNEDFFKEYKAVIEDQIENQVAVPTEEKMSANGYFMPHTAVLKPEKSTKLRVVFDASSKATDTSLSLNDCLLEGPNLNPNILDLLVRFRQHQIAIIADIEKAFLQISLRTEDRKFVKFFWLEGELHSPKVRTMAMSRVLFGATCSPFLLAATIRYHLERFTNTHPNTVDVLSKSFYVDDLVCSVRSVSDGRQLYDEAHSVMSSAGMKLRKWETNSMELRKYIREDSSACESIKVLGVSWNPLDDTLFYEPKQILDFVSGKSPTKRLVLQAIGRLFDPLGYLAPYTIIPKIMFQELWVQGLTWDSRLNCETENRWKVWCEQLHDMEDLTVPRWLSYAESDTSTIEVYCDASEKAYGTCAYLVCNNSSSLIVAKSRVAPLKKLTVPKLELMAAVIGARIGKYLSNLLAVNKVTYYTDSSVVLHWIRGDISRWKCFIANRVSEIRGLSKPDKWFHIPGTLNPADLLTRGETLRSIIVNKMWWQGPVEKPCTLLPEYSESGEDFLTATVSTDWKPVIDISRFSSFNRLQRTTAYVFKFFKLCQDKESPRELTTEEMDRAEKYLFKVAQQDLHVQTANGNSLNILGMSAFRDDDGVIRINTRLQNSGQDFNIVSPILLPNASIITRLIVRKTHLRLLHAGASDCIVDLRERFWIPQIRRLTKSVVHHCTICQRYRLKRIERITGQLPAERVTYSSPFTCTGLDFAGPLYLKDPVGKSYIALFTCAVTRAVHLELVKSMSTEDFLMAFRRFISRRGIPETIYSDNAKTFRRARIELSKLLTLLRSLEVKEFVQSKSISWKNIVERAPWWGGFYERMVRSVKACLKKTLSRNTLNFHQMETLLCEVEAVINSRPLSYVGDSDTLEILTPSNFLIGKRLVSLPVASGRKEILESNNASIAAKWKQRQALVKQFSKRWTKEYLLLLKSAHQVRMPKNEKVLAVDDVVIVHDDFQPKQLWKLAKVLELYVGRDGKIRSCLLKFGNGTELRRPVQLLYKLETQINSSS